MERIVKAGRQSGPDEIPKAFTLSLGDETITLEPGKPWSQMDRHKWVTRGLIEEPQSFHVLRDGTVEINGEKIRLDDPEGVGKFEREINKHHTPSVRHLAPGGPPGAVADAPVGREKVHFKVKFDHLGHMMIECYQAEERVETGMRGLQSLIHAGLMLKPKSIHVDPLQRFIEIDGVRFECNEAGARQLERALNASYAPALKSGHEGAIEIRENLASATGFDIHFVTVRAGVRFEVKEHLAQRNLNILQDPNRCDLLKPGILLRLAPPYLLVRRRRPDGGEESIPEIPDVYYLHTTAQQLEQVLNHPLIRKSGSASGGEIPLARRQRPPDILEIRVVRNPADMSHLWLECVTSNGEQPEAKALSHHNITQLQHKGVFLAHLEVRLSLDHRTLSILNKDATREETIIIDTHSSDEELRRAGRMLTTALKPPTTLPAESEAPAEVQTSITVHQPERRADTPLTRADAFGSPINLPSAQTERVPEESKPPPDAVPSDAAQSVSHRNQDVVALFQEDDPLRVNLEIFRRLAPRYGVDVQDVRFSLPRIFSDRRFQIINFGDGEIDTVLELRGEEFYGFYLSHISDRRIDFVYACHGTHIEWGTDKCVLQPSATGESVEFKGCALLGLAQDRDSQFVFVVTPAYKQWVRPNEQRCREAFAHFLTVNDLAAEPDRYTFIWPERQNV